MVDNNPIPQIDNPIQNIFDRVFKISMDTESVSDILDHSIGATRDPALYLSYLNKIDPHRLTSSMGALRPYKGAEGAGNLIKAIKSKGLLSPSMETAIHGLARIEGGTFQYNAERRALFFGDAKMGAFSPLPLQGPTSDIVTIGYKDRSVNTLGLIGADNSLKSYTFSEGYYSALNTHLASGSVHLGNAKRVLQKKVYATQIGTGPTLKSALQSGIYSRAIKSRYMGRSVGLKQLVSADPNSHLAVQLKRFNEAKRALSQITKTHGAVGKNLQELSIFSDFSGSISTADAYTRINQVFKEFDTEMPKAFEGLGINGLWPLSKAEHLIKGNRIVLPTQLAGDIYGTEFSEAAYSKGLHQLYKRAATSASLAKSILGVGDIPLRSYLTKGAFNAGTEFQQQGFGLRVGVVDFKSTSASRAIFEEGGALLTTRGSKKLASTLATHQVILKGPREETAAALEKLFKLNIAGSDLNNLNRVIPFNTTDVRNALKNTAGLSEKEQLIKELFSKSKIHRNVFKSAVKHRSKLNSIELRDGEIALNFIGHGTPAALEMEMGARRFTAVKKRSSYKFLNMLAGRGAKVDMFISADEFAKMHGPQVFLEQFFSVLKRENMLHEAAGVMLPNASQIRLPGSTRTSAVSIVDNEASAYKAALGVVQTMLNSGGDRAKIANEIQHGANVINNTYGLDKFGVTGVRLFTIPGGLRTDFMMDINLMKSARITPGKMRNIALSSKMLGFDSPYDDIVYSSFAKGWAGRGIGINPNTMDYMLEDTHLARQYAKGLIGKGNPEQAKIVRLTESGLQVGNTRLRSLPDLAKMGYSNGIMEGPGIPFSSLDDTILGKGLGKSSGILWLDLGEDTSLKMVDGATNVRSRYIPLPMKYLGATRGVGDRLILDKNNPAYTFVQAMKILEANPQAILNSKSAEYQASKSKELRNEFFNLMTVTNTKVVVKLSGKKGLFENQNTILSPYSMGARLIPDRSRPTIKSVNDFDNIFEIKVGRQELEEALYRRYYLDKKLAKKGWNGKNAGNTLKSLNERGFAYAMIGADPMQRPEHAQLVRMRVVDTIKRDAKFGQLNVSANQILLSSLERDTDRDRIMIHLLENMNDTSPENLAKFADRIKRQEEGFKMFKWVHLFDNKNALNGNPFSEVGTKTPGMFSSFVGQKTMSSLGYSFGRPIDAMMYGLASGDLSDIRMHQAAEGIVPEIIAPYIKDSKRAYVAETLLQNLYQGGVAKGKGKEGLIEVTQKAIGIAQAARQKYKETKVFNTQEIVEQGTTVFKEYLAGQKNRAFMAARYLLENSKMPEANIAKIEADLIRGADLAISAPELGKQMIEQTAQILSERYVLGHAFAATFSAGARSLQGVIQATRSTVKESAWQRVKKVLSPLVGQDLDVDEFAKASVVDPSPLIPAIEEAIEKVKPITTDSIFKKASAFFDNPSATKGLGIGMAVGAMGYAALSSLVTPDVDQPTDIGPQQSIAQMNRPRAYGPGMNISAGVGSPTSVNRIGAYRPSMSQNIDIQLKDNTRPFDPRLASAHMKRIANSDYTY